MAGTSNDICLLCDKELQEKDKRCVGVKGIESLIAASLKRKDKKHEQMQDLVSLNVHANCQTLYLRQSNIKAALKAASSILSKKRRESDEARKFDFSSLCFFCASDATTSLHKRPISFVTSDTIKENILIELDSRADDDFNKSLRLRLNNVYNLQQQKARYHQRCLSSFYSYRPTNVIGRPISDNMSSLIQHIVNYILDNSDDSQFSLKNILESFQGELPKISYIQKILAKHFGDEIIMYTVPNDIIICFIDTKGKVLNDKWYETKAATEEEERLRIVEMAANIILKDIRVKCYDTKSYNAPSCFLNDVEKDIPQSLKVFLDIIIRRNKVSEENKWSNRISTIAHILISCVRPRTYLSSILLGLSSLIHKKFAAKGLLNILSYLGLSASYHETKLFESSIVNNPEQIKVSDNGFVQFSFDNADHNTNTLDGFKTFHAMGGIMCVTPSSSVTSGSTITRLRKILPATDIGRFGFLPLKYFDRGQSLGLNNVVVQKFDAFNDELDISTTDFVWLHEKTTRPLQTVGWSGFQEEYHKNIEFSTSKIIPLPFVNNPPSDYNTIFTVLVEAAQKCKSRGQERCFVCFDQPLYLKAREIISCVNPTNDPYNLSTVTVRLGGFHMLMSFLGSIGFIMKGSGLKEAFCILYAEKSAEKALEGHAYARAIRAHILIQASLAATIFENICLTEEDSSCLSKYIENVHKLNEEWKLYYDEVACIKKKFIEQLKTIEETGPTCKLWIQYFNMINIVKRFIEAERIGNWELHLKCVKAMLPFFHASGHHLYAKSSHLYLQDMLELESIMDIFEYDKFAKSGFFTIRRSEKSWSGIFADMTIEQVLMKAMKTSGGLTRGRGITESVVAKWILSSIVLSEVANEIEKFCNYSFDTTDQHVDTRSSRKNRDAADLIKLNEFFNKYNPFPKSDFIMSIYSGIIGNKNVNCYNAQEEGMKVLDTHIGKPFASMKSSSKNKILSLASMTSRIKIKEDIVTINPLLIFQRLTLNLKAKEDMKNYLCYELAPFPLSLFDENGMRKTQKSSFYDNFEYLSENPVINENTTYIVDGGNLLHRVVWQRNTIMQEIIDKYVQYVCQYKKAVIVFDGYPEDTSSSLKSCERFKRQGKNVCREFIFDRNTIITEKQESFLSNNNNKKRLIDLLSVEIQNHGFETVRAKEDADRLIIQTAIRVSSISEVIIVGDDVDLIVLLTQLTPINKNIMFLKKGKGRDRDRWYKNSSFKYEHLTKYVAFLHCVSGCDTVSSLYKQGKNKLLKIFNTNHNLLKLIDIFYEKNANREVIVKNMCEIISLLYCNKKEGSLNEHRFQNFKRSTSRASFKLENLPPTEGAAKQHAFRVYLQLQKWLGDDKDATQWGWKIDDNILMPIYTEDPLIPEELLKIISCTCVSGCKTKICGCKKNNLKCTSVCLHCEITECENFDTPTDRIKLDCTDFTGELLETEEDDVEIVDENESEEEDSVSEDDEGQDLKRRKVQD